MNTNASSSIMSHWLNKATKKLEQAGISTARLDCLVLLEDSTGKDRSWLLAHPETILSGATLEQLDEQITRRLAHEPLSYIRGKSEFYGREFLVNAHTLEPRPETETLIAMAIKVLGFRLEVKERQTTIIDVGTGSGAIAITLKLERPELKVLASDISSECLKIAVKNSQNLNADVMFYKGNLLQPVYNLKPITSNLFAILANLPYVPDDYQINKAAQFEPRHAIFGGGDGLDLYRELFEQINSLAKKPIYVLTESLPFQHQELAKIAIASGYKLQTVDDFIQVFGTVDSRQ